jgi:DNA/RNA non-specific endonuclease
MGAVTAATGAQTTVPADNRPPPPPPLSAVQEGEVAAGRLRAVEGRLYEIPAAGRPNTAPPTAAWGDQPATTPYRQTFDQVAARLGTRDAATVGAEIDRQLYGAAATPSAQPAATPSQEGLGSVLEGAVLGDFSGNKSWSATAGQVAVGFVPIVGQIADARDTIASAGQVLRGEQGGWLNLGASVVGWVPGVGDAAKAAIRGGGNAVEAGTDVARTAARQGDEVAGTTARQVDEAVPRREIVMDGGEKGAWPKELNARKLEPNADYVVNGYRYATDAQGRVTSVSGKLDLDTAQRNGYQQRVSGRDDRLPGDQGGHLIASIFNGPGDRLNLVPMDGNLNTSAWKAMENNLADALKAGKQVDVKIEVLYDAADSARPSKFAVTQTIDGVESVRFFRNRPGG